MASEETEAVETAPIQPKRSLGRRLFKLLLIVAAALVVAILAAGLWVYSELKGSLPQLDGEAKLAGLAAQVRIERDAQGVPTIRASNRLDVARATGFLHAQERFFQMDLMRRSSAGELSELLGALTVDSDRGVRVHRFRARAQRIAASAPQLHRQLLEAYTEGVNAGLAALDASTFEYLLLQTDPAPWRPEDSILAVYAMYLQLQDSQGRRESGVGLMHDLLPEPLFRFLTPLGNEWDAPVVGQPIEAPPIPDASAVDLRTQARSGRMRRADREADWPQAAAGSNNWVVDAKHSKHGGALVANDMHLGIRVPNTWYRASFAYPGSDGQEIQITGVTLPGAPNLVVGSNGKVAWGFTNTAGDWNDLVVLEPVAGDPGSYLTPEGPRHFEVYSETIHIQGQDPQMLEVRETIWGPVIDEDHLGRQRAYRWVAHDPQAVNLELLGMEQASSVEEAFEIANRAGSPAQNFVVADAQGNIGWTVYGPIPRRFGHDGSIPLSWADGQRGWDGYLTPEEYPRILNPEQGRFWTANNRVVNRQTQALLGDGGYDQGARAMQIRDGLLSLEKASEADMLAIQLDYRALFLERWQKLLLNVLTPQAVESDPRRGEMRRLVEAWGGRAAVDSAGYRIVRRFRLELGDEVLGALTSACHEAEERFSHWRFGARVEGPLWQLVSQRPPHLLGPRYQSWDEQLLAAVDLTIKALTENGQELASQTWGKRNTTRIQHPLSAAIPLLGSWLNMPSQPLPGDSNMPRAQGPAFGASERMAVSPGREEEGIFHMPVGQSGHPLSPYFGAGHNDWTNGVAAPFLPGATVYTLTLVP